MSSYTTLQDNAWDSIAVYTFWGGYTTNRQFWLDRGVDKLTEVLLCLPNIAGNMATVDADGLYTAMGAFTLRALAKGHVGPNGKGGHTILVREIAVFVHDRFQFEQDAFPPNNNLGFWSCEKLQGGRLFKPPTNAESYFSLDNETFRVFRNGFGNGGDYPVLSMPHMVEHCKELRYDFA